MSSPFPGMNPYLERSGVWEGFHDRFVVHMGDLLASLVGDSYDVAVESRIYIHELSAEERRFIGRADVSVAGEPSIKTAAPSSMTEAPLRLSFPATETEKYLWLEIRDRERERIVAAIEVLSPTNKKPGPDRDDYLAKRARYMMLPIHFIEIDLLRAGTRPNPPIIPACGYYVLLTRAGHFGRADCWPLQLRDRLPVIPIPLAQGDPDVSLDLQALLDQVYDAARYRNRLYSKEIEPSLSAEDVEWAKRFVPAHPSNS